MKVKLVPIGNSRGVRIPRAIIEQCGLGEEIEMRVEDRHVVLAPLRGARDGWADAFAKAAPAKLDKPLLPDRLAHSWDAEEWEW
ncbi:MAG: AbrB/MazE/SpoVT family DNA-binding domain-containing protein [Alphaproteobacteria bacterium]|nr:AbrB/MazE/SpoVT family DNA-binding domain-containing protein [Alphaproteobacteria bacterium]